MLISLAISALLFSALYALSVMAGAQGYANLLMASGSSAGPGLSVEQLENWNGRGYYNEEGDFLREECLLTYEIPRTAAVSVNNNRHSVTLTGTNPYYPGMMGYPLKDGGFFTASTMNAKSKHAVLNETAAFALFGSRSLSGGTLRIDGDLWQIVGVIGDHDGERPVLYIPATVYGGTASSVIALMDETFTEARVKNSLKSIGIHDNNFDFLNFSRVSAGYAERFAVALKAALFAAIGFGVVAIFKAVRGKLRFYRQELRDWYLSELILRYRAGLMLTLGGVLLLAGGIGAMLTLSLQVLETSLRLSDIAPMAAGLAEGDFGRKASWLLGYQTPGLILFVACLCSVAVCAAVAAYRKGRANTRGKAAIVNGQS